MKRIEELGVSPAPWRAEGGAMAAIVYENRPTQECASVCAITGERRNADATLIAAAPALYEALREAVVETCQWCDFLDRADFTRCKRSDGDCAALRWREVLEKAGGAE